MDGKAVGRALREQVRPALRDAGFTSFTDRKAWREAQHTIDHVRLGSFSSYSAGVIGCTTYSVTAEVGVFYRCLDPDLERPQDYHCTFRAILGKTIRQPFFANERGPAMDRPDILLVLPDGSNLDEVVEEARNLLVAQGLPFLDRLRDPQRAFDALLTERSSNGGFGDPRVIFPGNPDSPRWRDTALAIGHLVMDDPRTPMRSAPVLDDA